VSVSKYGSGGTRVGLRGDELARRAGRPRRFLKENALPWTPSFVRESLGCFKATHHWGYHDLRRSLAFAGRALVLTCVEVGFAWGCVMRNCEAVCRTGYFLQFAGNT